MSKAIGIIEGVMAGAQDEQIVVQHARRNEKDAAQFVSLMAYALMSAKCIEMDADFEMDAQRAISVAQRNRYFASIGVRLAEADGAVDDELESCIDAGTLGRRRAWLNEQLRRAAT